MADETSDWEAASSWTMLGDDALDVWRVHLDALDLPTSAVLGAALSPDEAARAMRYHRFIDRERFKRGRGVLRALLGLYLGRAPDAVALTANAHGKPLLASSSLCFNVAHSDDLALYAFAKRRRVGVDVERVHDDGDWRSIAVHFFSAREQQALSTLSGPALMAAFFAIWTRKEAYVKARGLGLSLPLDSFDVDHEPGSRSVVTMHDVDGGIDAVPGSVSVPQQLGSTNVSPDASWASGSPGSARNAPSSPHLPTSLRADENGLLVAGQEMRGRWTISDLVVEPGYAAALSVEGDDAWRLRPWDWRRT